MPFTPYHFGPGATIAIPLNRYIDIPAFLLANIAIDIEPLTVMVFSLSYPLHGYFHTFLGSSIVCLILAMLLHVSRRYMVIIMREIFKKTYDVTSKKIIVSALLGGWFHVLLDSMLYNDIRPLFPSSANPFLGMVSHSTMYKYCGILFVPAVLMYMWITYQDKMKAKTTPNKAL